MRVLVAVATAVLLLCPSTSRGDRDDPARRTRFEFFAPRDEDGDLPFCVLLPYARCLGTVDVAIGYGGGRAWGTELQDREENDYLQLFVDAGYLFRLSRSPSFQLGPTVGLDAELFDSSRRYHLYATARARLWLWRWATLDAALGPAVSFDERWRPRAVGGIGELALTLHGHLGAYLQAQVLEGPDGLETRVTGGFRGSLTTWAILVAGLGG